MSPNEDAGDQCPRRPFDSGEDLSFTEESAELGFSCFGTIRGVADIPRFGGFILAAVAPEVGHHVATNHLRNQLTGLIGPTLHAKA